MSEYESTVWLANKLMNEPYLDQDSDEVMLARQFLQMKEACEYAAMSLQQSDNPPPIVVKDVRERLFSALHTFLGD